MPYETNAPALHPAGLVRVPVAPRRVHPPTPAGPRANWLRIGAWTTGVVLSAAVWTGVAMGIVALV